MVLCDPPRLPLQKRSELALFALNARLTEPLIMSRQKGNFMQGKTQIKLGWGHRDPLVVPSPTK